ncbi:MAG: hypothetical protein HYX80_06045 [Chloroflexi bacterium]|nr:hypothetical protein [Chloroflexota bacterium]
MNFEGAYDFKLGQLLYQEKKPKPRDMRKGQAAMFLDRPDLWKKPNRTRRQPPPTEQLSFPLMQQ